MNKNYTIKFKCESKEVKDAMMDVFLMSKGQLVHHLTSALQSKGIRSDIKIKIQGDEIVVTQKSGNKGFVLISQGIGMESVAYDTITAPSKYMVVKDGSVVIYIKMEDNIDVPIARFGDLEEAIANINSNDIETAFKNIVSPKVPELQQAPVMEINQNEVENGEVVN